MRKLLELIPEAARALILFFCVAFAGGFAKSLVYRRPDWKWADVLAQALASGFTGFVVGTLALRWLGMDHTDIVLALAGLSGWVGPSLMDYAATAAFNLFKNWTAQLEDKTPKDQPAQPEADAPTPPAQDDGSMPLK